MYVYQFILNKQSQSRGRISALINAQCWDSLHSALEIAVTAPFSYMRVNPASHVYPGWQERFIVFVALLDVSGFQKNT